MKLDRGKYTPFLVIFGCLSGLLNFFLPKIIIFDVHKSKKAGNVLSKSVRFQSNYTEENKKK